MFSFFRHRRIKMVRLKLVYFLLFSQFLSQAFATLPSDVKEVEEFHTVRANRFPSVEERVKLYMSNWYTPPCPQAHEGFIKFRFEPSKDKDNFPTLFLKGLEDHPVVNETQVMHVESIVAPDTLFFLDSRLIPYCVNEKKAKSKKESKYSSRIKAPANMLMYCKDIKELMIPALRHIVSEINTGNNTQLPPILLQFGDMKKSHYFGMIQVPHIKKFRSAANSKAEITAVTSQDCYSTPRNILSTIHGNDIFQPIIWKLATNRHYAKLYEMQNLDIPWSEKFNKAIFRGQLTGSRDGYNKKATPEENCQALKRCRLVYNHAHSKLVNAKLTDTRSRLPNKLNGVQLVERKATLSRLLKYKAIIMLEGNDVASGLKWALLSHSVVLMPPPQHTSWAMEELLEPWVVSLGNLIVLGSL